MQQLNIYDFLNENINNNSTAVKKSFSQLKKDLKIGVQVKTLVNNIKPEYKNEIRIISKIQTNGIAFRCIRNGKQTDSHLWWQKAANYEYINNIFKVYDDNKNLLFEYEILEPQEQPKTTGIKQLFNVLTANNLI